MALTSTQSTSYNNLGSAADTLNTKLVTFSTATAHAPVWK